MNLPRLALALGLGASLAAAAAFSFADAPKSPPPGFVPDPPSAATKKQWVFDILYKDGKPSITRVDAVFLNNPTPTARVMGRFAVELWVGKELLDRIRFEVPLLDDPSMHRKGPLSGPRFGLVTTRLKVRLADASRATWLALVDRSTGDTTRFAWPPEADGRLVPLGAQASPQGDAGAPPMTDAGTDAGTGDAGAPPTTDAGDAGMRDASADGS